ncbi:hypothetical protein [Methylibium sp.]|jgi:hypothetical protein|uniref:hypothetical protein n=1 Tax=Methylibium sp. TaxID=2067992 RepID=UPI003D0C6A7B
MSTISIQAVAPRKAPRGAEPLARAAAAVWQWAAGRLAQRRQPHDPRQDLPQLWALADKYQSVDPGLAADLRGAALSWERETQQS